MNPSSITRYPTSTSGRSNKPPFSKAVAAKSLRYFRSPSYQSATDSKAGGSYSQVILGPGGVTNAGTDADPKLPKAISDARNKYPRITFIAGHLLNADFGGDGKNPKNLTILTSQANSNHKNFDNPLKQAGAELNKAYEALWNDGIDISTVKIGIEVSVQIGSATWGSSYPDNCIFTELQCSAKLYGNIKLQCKDPKNQKEFDTAIGKMNALIGTANKTKVVKNSQPAVTSPLKRPGGTITAPPAKKVKP